MFTSSFLIEVTLPETRRLLPFVSQSLVKESDNLNAEAFLCRLGAQATGKKQVAAEDGIVEI